MASHVGQRERRWRDDEALPERPDGYDILGIRTEVILGQNGTNGITQRPIEGVSMAYTFDKAMALCGAPSLVRISRQLVWPGR
jgi:hypothetical protein